MRYAEDKRPPLRWNKLDCLSTIEIVVILSTDDRLKVNYRGFAVWDRIKSALIAALLYYCGGAAIEEHCNRALVAFSTAAPQ